MACSAEPSLAPHCAAPVSDPAGDVDKGMPPGTAGKWLGRRDECPPTVARLSEPGKLDPEAAATAAGPVDTPPWNCMEEALLLLQLPLLEEGRTGGSMRDWLPPQ